MYPRNQKFYSDCDSWTNSWILTTIRHHLWGVIWKDPHGVTYHLPSILPSQDSCSTASIPHPKDTRLQTLWWRIRRRDHFFSPLKNQWHLGHLGDARGLEALWKENEAFITTDSCWMEEQQITWAEGPQGGPSSAAPVTCWWCSFSGLTLDLLGQKLWVWGPPNNLQILMWAENHWTGCWRLKSKIQWRIRYSGL